MKTTYLLLVFLLAGCASDTGSGVLEHKILDINTSQISEGSFDDHFVLEEIIPLDTCREAVFRNTSVNYVYQMKDKLVLNSSSPQILVFDRKAGKFYKKMERVGRGPEEYSERARISIQDGDNIVVRGYNGDLMYYDVDGNFVKKNSALKEKFLFSEAELLPGGNVLVYAGLSAPKKEGEPYYTAFIFSPEGTQLKGMIERDGKTPKVAFTTGWSQFYTYEKEIFLAPYTENTIYQHSPADSLFKAIYTFNFNGFDFKQRLTQVSDNNTLQSFMQEAMMMYLAGITPCYLIVETTSKGIRSDRVCMLIDRRTGEIKVYPDKDISGSLIRNSLGKLMRLYTYRDLTDREGNLLDLPIVAQIQQLTAIDENMNGVLCIYDEKK